MAHGVQRMFSRELVNWHGRRKHVGSKAAVARLGFKLTVCVAQQLRIFGIRQQADLVCQQNRLWKAAQQNWKPEREL